jgi:DNA-binding response OmpR family regulator
MLLQDWLEALGYQIVGPAHTVKHAFALIDTNSPDAAVLDVSLGKEDCYPIADALKARGVPFVFATGLGVQSVAARHSSTPILTKPYDRDALYPVIAKLLAHSEK